MTASTSTTTAAGELIPAAQRAQSAGRRAESPLSYRVCILIIGGASLAAWLGIAGLVSLAL
jgi:hypothetical protein